MPVGGVGDRVDEVFDSDVGVWVEQVTVGGVEGVSHWFEVVADDEEGSADADGSEEIVDASSVWSAGDGWILDRDEIERLSWVSVEAVGVGVVVFDREVAVVRL